MALLSRSSALNEVEETAAILSLARHGDEKAGAFACTRFASDAAAEGVHAIDDNRQAQPRAGHAQFLVEMCVRAEEPIENGRLVGLRDAEAVIPHANRAGGGTDRRHLVGRPAGGHDLDEGLTREGD